MLVASNPWKFKYAQREYDEEDLIQKEEKYYRQCHAKELEIWHDEIIRVARILHK